MGIRDSLRNMLMSPADRRMRDEAMTAFAAAPQPSAIVRAAPFDGAPQRTPMPPAVRWPSDQPAPPTGFSYQPGYSDHTFVNMSAPLAFEDFTLERIRSACAAHRIGWFWETSALMVTVLGFAPVLAALQQAIAPILALPRHMHGGDRGLAKLVASELEEMLVPSSGLLPSPYLPPEEWGTAAIYFRMMGFCVLQHVDGEPDPDTGIRPIYTRVWEPWAVQKTRSPRKWYAITTEGIVEIKNDGKFTIILDERDGDLSAAILSLGEEALGGKLTQKQRLNWQDFFASPKLVAKLPEKVPTRGEAGDAFRFAVETIRGPDGYGILPYGSEIDAVTYGAGTGADQFQASLLDAIIHIFMVLTGSAGTIGNGMPQGAGVYQPAKGGAWSVRHDLIARPTIAIVRALNQGVCAPYCDKNYGEAIARAKRSGAWTYPTLRIPLPQPDRDERIASIITRENARTDTIERRRKNGILVDQPEADLIAADFDVRPVPLIKGARAEITDKDMEQKLFAPDEYRAAKGYDPLPGGAGNLDKLASDREAGLDKVGATKVTDDENEPGGDAPAEPAQEPPREASPTARLITPRTTLRTHASTGVLDTHQGTAVMLSQHSVKFDPAKSHAVYIRDGYKCSYCDFHDSKGIGENLSIDHLKSRAKGGAPQNTKRTDASNLATACLSCNRAKSDRTPEQWAAYQKGAGKPVTDYKALREKAKKGKIDIKAGEKAAVKAKAFRDDQKAREAGGAAPAAPVGGGGGKENTGDEHHPPGTPHP